MDDFKGCIFAWNVFCVGSSSFGRYYQITPFKKLRAFLEKKWKPKFLCTTYVVKTQMWHSRTTPNEPRIKIVCRNQCKLSRINEHQLLFYKGVAHSKVKSNKEMQVYMKFFKKKINCKLSIINYNISGVNTNSAPMPISTTIGT